jgi:hypothetical protein
MSAVEMCNSSQTRYSAYDLDSRAAIFHSLFHTTVEKLQKSRSGRARVNGVEKIVADCFVARRSSARR